MADKERRNDTTDNLDRERNPSTDSDAERERVRSSNDLDQKLEREGVTSKQNRGYDQAAHGEQGPTDPDSASSDIDRDDMVSD